MRLFILVTLSLSAFFCIDADRPIHYRRDTVKLIDSTFEHQTQASTGQTTGSWLVWFYEGGEKTVLEGQVEKDFWSEHNVVLASVHAGIARETAKRFSIVETPQLLFFHKRQLYRYKGDWHWDQVTEFVTGGYQTVTAEEVPPPRSEFAKAWDKIWGTVAGHMILFGLLLAISIIMVYFLAMNAPIKEKSS